MDNKLHIQRIHANQLLGFTEAGGLQAQTETVLLRLCTSIPANQEFSQ